MAGRTRPLNGRKPSRPKPGIVAVNPRQGGYYWHWVVWDGTRIIDPKRDPYQRLTYISYMPVRKAPRKRNA
jgi:hypothetical protein